MATRRLLVDLALVTLSAAALACPSKPPVLEGGRIVASAGSASAGLPLPEPIVVADVDGVTTASVVALVDRNGVYWMTGQSEIELWRTPHGQKSATKIWSSTTRTSWHAELASDGVALFLSISTEEGASLSRLSPAGSPVEVITGPKRLMPGSLVVGATNLYWLESFITGSRHDPGLPEVKVWRAAKQAPFSPEVMRGAGEPKRLFAVSATGVYLLTGKDELARLPLAGGAAMILSRRRPVALAVDDTHVYCAFGSTLVRMLDREGAAEEIVATDAVGISAVAVDDAGVYYATLEGAIHRVTADGHASVLAQEPHTPPGQLYVDGSYVYWVSGRKILKVPKS